MLYVPNIGELEMLRSILQTMEINLGLYKNSVLPDGNTITATLVELATGGGRAYAPKILSPALVESALAADKWLLALNAQGKAEGQYHNAALTWVMAQADVNDAATLYGAFAYIWVLPFDGGVTEIKPGDLIKGGDSGALATVALVSLLSGTWGVDAAGVLFLKGKSGAWQNDENILPNGKIATIAVNAGGANYQVGDIVGITQPGGAGAKAVVTTVNAGAVTSLVLVEGGQGYAVATSLATTALTGAGTGLTVDISALSTLTLAVSNSGTLNGGDAHKRLLFVDAFSEGYAIDTVGLTVEYTPKISLSTA
ncbi:MAG: hypothetical protein ACOZF2_11290 [Thermodesulfobacteriota bacterium]